MTPDHEKRIAAMEQKVESLTRALGHLLEHATALRLQVTTLQQATDSTLVEMDGRLTRHAVANLAVSELIHVVSEILSVDLSDVSSDLPTTEALRILFAADEARTDGSLAVSDETKAKIATALGLDTPSELDADMIEYPLSHSMEQVTASFEPDEDDADRTVDPVILACLRGEYHPEPEAQVGAGANFRLTIPKETGDLEHDYRVTQKAFQDSVDAAFDDGLLSPERAAFLMRIYSGTVTDADRSEKLTPRPETSVAVQTVLRTGRLPDDFNFEDAEDVFRFLALIAAMTLGPRALALWKHRRGLGEGEAEA